MEPLNDIQKWQIEMLARFGGFSHQLIASKVNAARNQVSYWLHKSEIKVRDWRNGVSPESIQQIRSVIKPSAKKSRSKSRKVA